MRRSVRWIVVACSVPALAGCCAVKGRVHEPPPFQPHAGVEEVNGGWESLAADQPEVKDLVEWAEREVRESVAAFAVTGVRLAAVQMVAGYKYRFLVDYTAAATRGRANIDVYVRPDGTRELILFESLDQGEDGRRP